MNRRKTMTRLFAAVMILTAGAVAVADETPNINPGLWKHDTTMTFMGDFPIPDQKQSEEQCVTAEEIAKGGNFLDDVGEECAISRQEIHRLQDRKSTRLNSSHVAISYAVFCLKKKSKACNCQR